MTGEDATRRTWTALPRYLTAVAAVVTAIATCLGVLVAVGVFDGENERQPVTGADKLVRAMPTPAVCATFFYVTNTGLRSRETDSYKSGVNNHISAGVYLKGTGGGSRENGWTPVEWYSTKSSKGPWNTLLAGANDKYDFVRTSGLDYISCT